MKRILTLSLAFVLLFSISTIDVSAARKVKPERIVVTSTEVSTEAVKTIDEEPSVSYIDQDYVWLSEANIIAVTEAVVDTLIQKAQYDASIAMDTLKNKALEAELDRIIDDLLEYSYGAVTIAIDIAATQDIELERTWIPVLIGDRIVLVDPLRSVRF